MHWMPKVRDGYWLTPLQWKGAELAWTVLGILLIIGVNRMFANVIDSIYWMIGIAGVCVLCWLSIMQYTRFKENYFRDEGTEKAEASSKFAFIPYFLIPLLFAVACGAVALCITDVCAGKGYVTGPEEIVALYTVLTVGLYMCADYRLISRIGDVAYLMSIEKKADETAQAVVKKAASEITVTVNGQEITGSQDFILQLLQQKQ